MMTRSTNMEHVEVLRRAADELRRADALARKCGKINRHKVIGRAAGNNLSVILSALDSLSAPQPPAEAQPVAWMRRAARYRGVDGRQEGERIISESKVHDDDVPLYAHPPPSAPVGGGLIEAAKAAESMLRTVHQCASHDCEDCREHAGIHAKHLRDALAQQPAAAGEEIMVNAAHDVYTLPLQPSGLSSGPRFVVHVPGPEQPAAPSGEASVIIDNYRRSATQPGGSDNDR